MDKAASQTSVDRAPLRHGSRLIHHGANSRSTVPSSPPVFPASSKLAHLQAENAELAQALLEMEKDLNASKQATHDLAAWTLNERTRLMTEALHQRLLREDCEATLRQRDKQVVELRALHQQAKLDYARTLIREGDAMGRPVSTEELMRINEMRARVRLPLIDERGAFLMARGAGNYSSSSSAVVQDVLGRCDGEEGGVVGDEEGVYSPPDVESPASITDQVDALIAEEKSGLVEW